MNISSASTPEVSANPQSSTPSQTGITAKNPQHYDAIVIGSGMGGLTTAALLSKCFKKRVLVLEQHFKAGGFTHEFQRKGKFHWDVGLHYVGEMAPGSLARSAFDYLSEGRLDWQKMPDTFEKFVYPDFTFPVSADPKKYLADLSEQFPSEAAAIRQYFKDIGKASSWVITHAFLEVIPPGIRHLVGALVSGDEKLAKETTQHYLNRNFKDPRLKALLMSQWGDYGLPPSKSNFGIHSVVVEHYLNGAWYPVGGSGAIAKSLIPTIERAGGAVMVRQKVIEIVVAAGKAKGVKVQQTANPSSRKQSEEEIFYPAPVVISDAGAYNTFLKLIPEHVALPERDALRYRRGADNAKSTIVTLYLGLKENPQKLGFHGENHWIYRTYDHEHVDDISILKETDTAAVPDVYTSCYLTFPSLKDPMAKGHTAEIITDADYDFFEQWAHHDWRKRGKQYEDLKLNIVTALIQIVEKHYPGFQDLIEYQELATPLTFQHFVDNQQGEIYGAPFTANRFDQTWTRAKTSIINLYLTGADTFTPGVVGAMWGGTKAAGLVQGSLGFPQVMVAALTARYRSLGKRIE